MEDRIIRALSSVRIYHQRIPLCPTSAPQMIPLEDYDHKLNPLFDNDYDWDQCPHNISLNDVTFTHYYIQESPSGSYPIYTVYLFCFDFPKITVKHCGVPDIPGGTLVYSYTGDESGARKARDRVEAALHHQTLEIEGLEGVPDDIQRRFGRPLPGSSVKRAL